MTTETDPKKVAIQDIEHILVQYIDGLLYEDEVLNKINQVLNRPQIVADLAPIE